jgi:7-cyano-7-deazaguanine synthase in queuosine biosynthesis
MREKLSSHPDCDKEFIKILLQVQEYGLEKVNQICSALISDGIYHADTIIKRLENKPNSQLFLQQNLSSDCSCYDKSFLKLEETV